MKVITSREPRFLKEAYQASGAQLIDHEGFVDDGEPFTRWDGKHWIVYRMTPSRLPRFAGRFAYLMLAMAHTKH